MKHLKSLSCLSGSFTFPSIEEWSIVNTTLAYSEPSGASEDGKEAIREVPIWSLHHLSERNQIWVTLCNRDFPAMRPTTTIRDFHTYNLFYCSPAANKSKGSPKACSFHEKVHGIVFESLGELTALAPRDFWTPDSSGPQESPNSSSHLWERRVSFHGPHIPSPERLNSCSVYGVLKLCAPYEVSHIRAVFLNLGAMVPRGALATFSGSPDKFHGNFQNSLRNRDDRGGATSRLSESMSFFLVMGNINK